LESIIIPSCPDFLWAKFLLPRHPADGGRLRTPTCKPRAFSGPVRTRCRLVVLTPCTLTASADQTSRLRFAVPSRNPDARSWLRACYAQQHSTRLPSGPPAAALSGVTWSGKLWHKHRVAKMLCARVRVRQFAQQRDHEWAERAFAEFLSLWKLSLSLHQLIISGRAIFCGILSCRRPGLRRRTSPKPSQLEGAGWMRQPVARLHPFPAFVAKGRSMKLDRVIEETTAWIGGLCDIVLTGSTCAVWGP